MLRNLILIKLKKKIKYLNKLYKRLFKLRTSFKNKVVLDISIFLHKYDRNLIDDERFQDIEEKINNELIVNLKEIVPSQFNYKIFTTSIYALFEKNLLFKKLNI